MFKGIVRTAMAVFGMACLVVPALSQREQHEQREFKTLDFPGAATMSIPLGINNEGDIAGYYDDASGFLHGYVRIHGKFQTVDFPGAFISGCGGISDDLDVTGTYFDMMGFQHGYLLHKGKFQSIDVPGAGETTGIPFELGPGLGTAAFGINNNGAIVGEYADSSGVAHGYRYRNGKFLTIDHPDALPIPGLGTNVFTINDDGAIAGVYYTPSLPYAHGFVYHHKTFTPINFPGSGGPFGTQANGVNNEEDVVGLYSDTAGNGHGFLLQEGKYTSINFPGAVFTECHCINDCGMITGLYYDAMGAQHGYISTRK